MSTVLPPLTEELLLEGRIIVCGFDADGTTHVIADPAISLASLSNQPDHDRNARSSRVARRPRLLYGPLLSDRLISSPDDLLPSFRCLISSSCDVLDGQRPAARHTQIVLPTHYVETTTRSVISATLYRLSK